MMKDRAQKAMALRYIVARHWFPQLEVDVTPPVSTSSTNLLITDVDVLGLIPDEFEGFRTLLVDCKTGKNESPMTRAIWQRGLMDMLNATRGICVLKRNQMELDHRQAALQLNVLLLTEDDFIEYIRSTAPNANYLASHLADLDLWEKHFGVGDYYPKLSPTLRFTRSGYWLSRSDGESCRRVILETIRARPELDPAKVAHIALVGDLISLFMHAVANLTTRIFAGYLKPAQRATLSDALLYLIYGGREAYGVRDKIRRVARNAMESEIPELSLPEWDRFVQLVRQCLDAPTEITRSPLIIREVAWSFHSSTPDLSFAKTLAATSPQAAKLALLGAEYLCRATKLPPEFQSILGDTLLAIQQTPP